jgi:7,8-dihydropterin-6-yl-methyl-4-(beta-D-ribofuranosyl)aminobenzene 5'-phosphate synthase
LAEHGLSCLIKVHVGSEEHIVLMDAGLSAKCFLHNVEVFGVDLEKIECVFLSHGHRDHFGGLKGCLHKTREGVPLYIHPSAFLERRLNIPSIGVKEMPKLGEIGLDETGATLHMVSKASTFCSDLVLALGKVERFTDFEKGFPWAEAKIDGEWVVDPFHDDQGLAVHVRGKGLVVVGGCSHAGIINTVRHGRRASGIDSVHAVLGGFHLSGPIFEPVIGPTINEMKELAPDFIAPMHCTGWKAINQFAQAMPDQFLLNSVGTTYVFR